MRYQLLGRSGLRVSELCLGTMTFGEDWGWGSSKDTAKGVFDAFIEAGGNFLDTANLYTNGSSERILGEFIHADRNRYVVATKYTLNMDGKGDPNAAGNHRKNMVLAVEASLKRLNTEYIDLYWVHAWDTLTPIEEMLRAFDDLVRAGKILYIGCSDFPAWQVSRANTMAELRGWTPFSALQIEYSLIERTVERELIPMANELGLTVTPWAPLGAGILSGKYTREPGAKTSRGGALTEDRLRIADSVAEVAHDIGCSPAQVALAWLRYQPGSVIPIIGARTVEQIKDNLGSINVQLSPDHLSKLDEASKVDLGFPMKFLSTDRFRQMISGGTWSAIDHRRK
ncbi:MAG TPA: aldo/keto reductase [Bryobacteraceae bacterium]|jgi:aryl-alcohol dehydrogenase-like predicted oxidoreductase